MKSNIGIIIGREFSERVAKKSFLITTLLMPVFMLVLMVAPALIMQFSSPSEKTIVVADRSGLIFGPLAEKAAEAEYLTLTRADNTPVDSLVADTRYDGVLFIGDDIVDNPSNAVLYLHDAGSLELEGTIASTIEKVVEDRRLEAYNIADLDRILDEVKADVTLTTRRVDEEQGERDSLSSDISFGIGLFMTFVLYMFLLLYGQMVMTSIIEEKNNRVLELVVSSVKPVQLMLGKIIGVGLVAVVQVAIWAVLICLMTAFLLPALLPADVAAQMAAAQAGGATQAMADGSGMSLEALQAFSLLTSVGYILKIFLYLTVFLIGGFLFYASIFAAIGSTVDNIQDASQLQSFAILPIILGLVFSMTVASDPNSPLAFWLSVIPFTSPMVMMARIPFDIPQWQIWTSAAVLYASFVAMAWVAGKVYRVGIFMYGKKPTVKDLVRWARYT